jgi:hypothetical protein
MRSLETIHLDELDSKWGVAAHLTYGYAIKLAKAARDRYGKSYGVWEKKSERSTRINRFYVAHAWQDDLHLTDVIEPELPTVSAPEIKAGDRIRYNFIGRGAGDRSIWDGALVTEIDETPPYAGWLRVTARCGDTGLIAPQEAELWTGPPPSGHPGPRRLPPVSRSTTHRTVGCYELVPLDDGQDQYRRLALRSIPRNLDQGLELAYLDSLIQTCAVENDLDVAALFTMQNAPKFEAESEGRIIS